MSVLFKAYSTYLAKQMKKKDDITMKKLKEVGGVKEIKDIRYFKGKNKYHLFNMYYPESCQDISKLPVMIQIHGGGWIYGDKDLSRFHNSYYASKGMVVLSMSYRLLLRTNLLGIVKDLFHFFNFIEKNAKELNLSFDNVMLCGDSAGGHLALLINAINQNEEMRKLYGVTSFSIQFKLMNLEHPVPFLKDLFTAKGMKLAHVCLMSAFFGRKYKKNPLYYCSSFDDIIDKATYPYIMIVSSTLDTFKGQTTRVYEELKKRNIPCEFRIYENEPHVFEVSFYDKPNSIEYNNHVIETFKKIISK